VFRAKGNEAPIIYIIAFDAIYDYVNEVEMRNRAFTAISRAKGFVRISGTGEGMSEAVREINSIRADLPAFKFVFPDMAKIERNLDVAETYRRKRDVRLGNRSLDDLNALDPGALAALPRAKRAALIQRLKELEGESGEP
jgi:superfamily I DNA and RNA helicase